MVAVTDSAEELPVAGRLFFEGAPFYRSERAQREDPHRHRTSLGPRPPGTRNLAAADDRVLKGDALESRAKRPGAMRHGDAVPICDQVFVVDRKETRGLPHRSNPHLTGRPIGDRRPRSRSEP